MKEQPLHTPNHRQTDHRLADIRLQGTTSRSPEIEMERHRALSDLLHDSRFGLPAAPGPYRLTLSLAEGRLLLDIECTGTQYREDLRLSLKPLKQQIHDYGMLVESFYKTAKSGPSHRLETLDAGRRALHDEGAAILMETLENKVILDKATARRLFTLVYVLHIRTPCNNLI